MDVSQACYLQLQEFDCSSSKSSGTKSSRSSSRGPASGGDAGDAVCRACGALCGGLPAMWRRPQGPYRRYLGGPRWGPVGFLGSLCIATGMGIIYALSLQQTGISSSSNSSTTLQQQEESQVQLFPTGGPCSSSSSSYTDWGPLGPPSTEWGPRRRLSVADGGDLKSLSDASYREFIGIGLIALASIVAVCAGTGGKETPEGDLCLSLSLCLSICPLFSCCCLLMHLLIIYLLESL